MVKEYHVDSTYRTNQAGCELFAVIGNINGAGFPVAYLFFKHNLQENETSLASGCKIPAMTAMFQCMHERGLAPLFMFCDKDISEIVSITNVWGPYKVRLCLWHLKQAVDRGLSKPRGQIDPIYDVGVAISEFPFMERDFLPNRAVGSRLAPKTNRDAIVAMMGDHYCRHPLLFEGTVSYVKKKKLDATTIIC
ncbi:hypothetical protein [Absidia glauca]|uniref:MULE transposase domain-containing protein n=1 Tax=Absidia glauca TaxID=4829 RepID=A0A163J687_ABSGL|nr:hypothetical protein [Absidia glauca]